MTYDPTTSAAWIVQGEQELGPQRRCTECREWWPLTVQFWRAHKRVQTHRRGAGRWPSQRLTEPIVRKGYLQPCKACRGDIA